VLFFPSLVPDFPEQQVEDIEFPFFVLVEIAVGMGSLMSRQDLICE
jgi:hypothetical protein